jgi:hypothetical protein
MENEQVQVNGWQILNPFLLVKLGFVVDEHKKPMLGDLWRGAEENAKTRLPLFKAEDFFFEENISVEHNLIYSFRYYTPLANRIKTEEIRDYMQ